MEVHIGTLDWAGVQTHREMSYLHAALEGAELVGVDLALGAAPHPLAQPLVAPVGGVGRVGLHL